MNSHNSHILSYRLPVTLLYSRKLQTPDLSLPRAQHCVTERAPELEYSRAWGPVHTSNFSCTELMLLLSTWKVRRMNQLGSADLYSGRLHRSIRLGLSDRTAKDRHRFIHRSSHVPSLMHKLRSCISWYKRVSDWLVSYQKGSRAWNGATAKKSSQLLETFHMSFFRLIDEYTPKTNRNI